VPYLYSFFGKFERTASHAASREAPRDIAHQGATS